MINQIIESKDKEIRKLNQIIEDFKKYDNKRKEYYKNAMIRLGELESILSEFKDGDDQVQYLLNKVQEQRRQLGILNTKLAATIIKPPDLTDEELKIYVNKEKLLNEIARTKKVIEGYKRAISIGSIVSSKRLWIARNKDGSLYMFDVRPSKNNEGIWIFNEQQCHSIKLPRTWFNSVKWEDDEPRRLSLALLVQDEVSE